MMSFCIRLLNFVRSEESSVSGSGSGCAGAAAAAPAVAEAEPAEEPPRHDYDDEMQALRERRLAHTKHAADASGQTLLVWQQPAPSQGASGNKGGIAGLLSAV